MKKLNWIAVITMIFIYGMISFVTNLAAPMGNVWKYQPGIEGSNMLGMMGNMMNFLAYLFMGIPAGKMLTKVGYKKTALIAIATGFVGVAIQFVSGMVPASEESAIVPFTVYLAGAFVCGFSVCMLNMVVNPMLNLLGGGGNRGNQLNLVCTTFNSVCGTATPMLVGALIGQVTKATKIADVNLVLYIALAVFAATFVILQFIRIDDPEATATQEDIPVLAPLKFRHCLLGVIGIFMYVGIEVGIPGTLNLWLADPEGPLAASGTIANPAAVAGMVAGTYWFLMLVGRTIGAFIGGAVSSRTMTTVTAGVGVLLIGGGAIIQLVCPETVSMPVFTGTGFAKATVPLTALLFALCGLCTSVMWPSIFNLSTEGLGKYTAAASGLFMVMVVGGGILPLIQNGIVDACHKDTTAFMISFAVPAIGLAYLFIYAVFFSTNVNTDIKVD
ncbi:MAG: MFS transporter [Kiritimatiellae bacterium]|nr:MFS transporter [Kiritimatiellia bacterium]